MHAQHAEGKHPTWGCTGCTPLYVLSLLHTVVHNTTIPGMGGSGISCYPSDHNHLQDVVVSWH